MGMLLILAAAAVFTLIYFASEKVIFDGEANAMLDWGPTLSKTHKVAHIIFGEKLPGSRILVATVTNEQAALIKSFEPVCFVKVKVIRNSLTGSTRVTSVNVVGPKSSKAQAQS